jgi:hypothetical protein
MLLMQKIKRPTRLGQYPSDQATYAQQVPTYTDPSGVTDQIDLTYEPPGMTPVEAKQLEAPTQKFAMPTTTIGKIFTYLILFGGLGLGLYFMSKNK